MTTRRRHFAVESLSEEGQAIVRRGFEDGRTLEAIKDEVRSVTSELIGVSSLHRWQKWQETQRRWTERAAALDTATELIRAVPDPRFITALNNALKDHLTDKVEDLQNEDAAELLAHLLRMERLQLAHRKTQIDEQFAKAATIKAVAAEKAAEAALTQADAAMKRVELLEAKMKQAAGELEKAERSLRRGRSLTVEEIRALREQLVGISDDDDDNEGDDG